MSGTEDTTVAYATVFHRPTSLAFPGGIPFPMAAGWGRRSCRKKKRETHLERYQVHINVPCQPHVASCAGEPSFVQPRSQHPAYGSGQGALQEISRSSERPFFGVTHAQREVSVRNEVMICRPFWGLTREERGPGVLIF